jgi:hypothetical protein
LAKRLLRRPKLEALGKFAAQYHFLSPDEAKNLPARRERRNPIQNRSRNLLAADNELSSRPSNHVQYEQIRRGKSNRVSEAGGDLLTPSLERLRVVS